MAEIFISSILLYNDLVEHQQNPEHVEKNTSLLKDKDLRLIDMGFGFLLLIMLAWSILKKKLSIVKIMVWLNYSRILVMVMGQIYTYLACQHKTESEEMTLMILDLKFSKLSLFAVVLQSLLLFDWKLQTFFLISHFSLSLFNTIFQFK